VVCRDDRGRRSCRRTGGTDSGATDNAISTVTPDRQRRDTCWDSYEDSSAVVGACLDTHWARVCLTIDLVSSARIGRRGGKWTAAWFRSERGAARVRRGGCAARGVGDAVHAAAPDVAAAWQRGLAARCHRPWVAPSHPSPVPSSCPAGGLCGAGTWLETGAPGCCRGLVPIGRDPRPPQSPRRLWGPTVQLLAPRA